MLVVVEGAGRGPWHQGDFKLHIRALTESEAGACFDGTDDDADGAADSADSDCR